MLQRLEMRHKAHTDSTRESRRPGRLFRWIISPVLFLGLFSIFGKVFARLLGTSDLAWIAGAIVSALLASLAHNIIYQAFPALVILALFALPSIAFVLIFLLWR